MWLVWRGTFGQVGSLVSWWLGTIAITIIINTFTFHTKKRGKKMKIVRNFLNIENRFASAATTFGWSAIFHWSANGLIQVGQYKFNCKRSSKTIATQNHGKALVNWVEIMEKRLKLNRNRWKKLTHWQRNPIERKQLEKH